MPARHNLQGPIRQFLRDHPGSSVLDMIEPFISHIPAHVATESDRIFQAKEKRRQPRYNNGDSRPSAARSLSVQILAGRMLVLSESVRSLYRRGLIENGSDHFSKTSKFQLTAKGLKEWMADGDVNALVPRGNELVLRIPFRNPNDPDLLKAVGALHAAIHKFSDEHQK